jgi:hypothetical protein
MQPSSMLQGQPSIKLLWLYSVYTEKAHKHPHLCEQ